MSRVNPLLLIVVLILFLAVFAGTTILKGGLFLDSFEIDSYHLVDILFRLQLGQTLYQDFVTPLGLLALLPISVLLDYGLSVGAAMAWSQIVVALCLFPLAVYVAATRFNGILAYLFGILVLGLTTAMTLGGAHWGSTFGMYYNRWAWAISFTLIALAFLPSQGRDRPVLEGAAIGVASTVLLLLKITYFAAIVPPVALLLLLRRDLTRFGAACVSGLALLAVVTAFFGVSFWSGYIDGLLNVQGSELRPSGGKSLSQLIAGNSYLAITLLAAVSVLMISRAKHDLIALALLILIPGFYYVTYQNYGTDPQWLLFLPFLLLSLRPVAGEHVFWGMDLRTAMGGAALTALALIAPSLVNLTLSPVNHYAFDRQKFEPMLTEMPAHHDLLIRKDRAYTLAVRQYLDESSPFLWVTADDATPQEPVEFNGITFPKCELQAATLAYYRTLSADLAEAGIPEGSQFFTADLSKAFWLFGPYQPLKGDAPWYYGGLSGIENADYVIVPKCSFIQAYRDYMIQEMIEADLSMTLVRDNDLYALFRLN